MRIAVGRFFRARQDYRASMIVDLIKDGNMPHNRPLVAWQGCTFAELCV